MTLAECDGKHSEITPLLVLEDQNVLTLFVSYYVRHLSARRTIQSVTI